jgi:AcrR family transcriptional regulator
MSKQEQILSTAERLFSQFGSRRVTVEEICREAGVSKPTFYKNFSSKVDLLRTIHDELVERGFAKFDEISALDIPFAEKIDLMGRWKLEYASRFSADFFQELIDIEHSMEEFKRRYLNNIRKAQQQGEVRQDIDPEFLWAILDKLGEMLKDGSWKEVCTDFAQLQRQLRTLIWYGLLVREEEGHETDG